MTAVAPGTAAAVSVPATSGNLGAGFDCVGLALDLRDDYEARVVGEPGFEVESTGFGAAELPRDGSHLVAQSMRAGLERIGLEIPGVKIICRNRIPHSRGLGSSAAAIVGGAALAYALADIRSPEAVSQQNAEVLQLAAEVEGHSDNAAPAVLGGLTVSWWSENTGRTEAISSAVADSISVVMFLPEAISPTKAARAALPDEVPLADAVHNCARSALLIPALTGRPELLFDATADRLHQESRRQGYPAAMTLVDDLRSRGVAAAISGAGPGVIAFCNSEQVDELNRLSVPGYQVREVGVGNGLSRSRI